MLSVAERKYALFGARFFLIAPRPAESNIETMRIERLSQPFRIPKIGVDLRTMGEGVDAQA